MEEKRHGDARAGSASAPWVRSSSWRRSNGGVASGLCPQADSIHLSRIGTGKNYIFSGFGHIEIQVRSNQVQSQFLALYLVRRTKFLVSCVIEIHFAYNRDTFCGSLDTETESWF